MLAVAYSTSSIEKLGCKKSWRWTGQAWNPEKIDTRLFATLLQLPLTSVPHKSRRKIGPPPTFGKKDPRSMWHPPASIDGKVHRNIPFDAYTSLWPQDQSPLAGKTLLAYFPKLSSGLPTYLPHWLEVSSLAGRAYLRAVDSGKGLRGGPPLPKALANLVLHGILLPFPMSSPQRFAS